MQISIVLSQEDIDIAINDYMFKKGYTINGELKYDSQPGRCTFMADLKVNKPKRNIETEQ